MVLCVQHNGLSTYYFLKVREDKKIWCWLLCGWQKESNFYGFTIFQQLHIFMLCLFYIWIYDPTDKP
jgi:hypothetical protein